MKNIETDKYILRLLDKTNKNELQEVQKLRYDYLLKDFNDSLDESGIDDDGYDMYADSIIVIEKETNKIVGTYRLASLDTIKDSIFKTETEFNIDDLRKDPDGILEASRAVVHEDYREGGIVIGLLWRGMFTYAEENNLRYIFGTCSLHGTNPKVHSDTLAYLNNNIVSDKFNIYAIHDSYEYPKYDISMRDANIPPLLKAYMRLGTRISRNGFIDYEFNCCDVVTIIDIKSIDQRYLKHFLGM